MAKRRYELSCEAVTGLQIDDRQIKIGDFGSTLKLSGTFYQGMGQHILLLLPSAADFSGINTEKLSLEEWCAVLKQTDDPVFFEDNQHWMAKAVVRKQQYAISHGVQWVIFERDIFRCMYCGRKGGVEAGPLTVDHFIPLELGGGSTPDNLLSACKRCAKRKGCVHPEQYCTDNELDYEGLVQYLQGKIPGAFIEHLAWLDGQQKEIK